MRIAFMGSPDFAVPALRALHDVGHEVVMVYCQPARPAGRGQAVRKSPVQRAAEQLGMPVRSPTRLRADTRAAAEFAALELDAGVIAAYGLILPQAFLNAPRHGCLNIHASLLPRWRGAAPIQAAIRAGDTETGVTIMQMEAGLDTGPMLLSRHVPITGTTTTAELHDVLAATGADLILQAMAGSLQPVPQPSEGATYAPKLSREDGRIDWNQTADAVDRQVRAFDPWPGTFTVLTGQLLKVLAVALVQGCGIPGTVIDPELTVACGAGAVRLTRVQLPGRTATDGAAFLRGHPVPAGTLLGA